MNSSSRTSKTKFGTANKCCSAEKILRDKRAPILRSWKTFRAQWLPAVSVGSNGESDEVLVEEMFEDLRGIVSDLTRNSRQLKRRKAAAPGALLLKTGASLPGVIQFIFCCGEDLVSQVRKSREFALLSERRKEEVLKLLEAACAILVHREAHSLANHFRKQARAPVAPGQTATVCPITLPIAG